jgi:hypothetical protein
MSYTADIVDSYLSVIRNFADTAYSNTNQYLITMSNYLIAKLPMEYDPAGEKLPDNYNVDVDFTLQSELDNIGMDDLSSIIAPDDPAVPGDHPFPNAPSYHLPSIPVMRNIILPDFVDGLITMPTTLIPDVSVSSLGIDTLSATNISDGGLAPEDNLIAAIRNKLTGNIVSGGTMINPAVENDIWNRDSEREEQALQDQLDKLTLQWAALGWSLPDGLLAGSYLAVNNEYMNKRLDRSREISVKQAQLEQDGMFKSIELANGFEKTIFENYNNYAKRVLETSKIVADQTIQIFKERINGYNYLLEQFKADVEGYKAKIQAELGRVTVFKTKVEAQGLISQMNENDIKIYVAQIESCKQLVDIYKTQVSAVATQYEAEKSRIEAYKAMAEVYSVKIEAITKKYLAGVEKLKAYVQAYSASVDRANKVDELNLKAEAANIEVRMKEWEIQLKEKHDSIGMQLEAIKSAAQISSNVVAGALSAMNIQVGQSIAGHESVNHNYNY